MDAGGQEDFEIIYRAHSEMVKRYLQRRVQQAHMAEDLCADVFVAALISLDTFDPSQGTFRQWLMGIARHRLSRLWQTAARAREADARVASLEAAPSEEPDMERAEWRAMTPALHRELGHLPDPYRVVVTLRYLCGCSYEQISTLVGCPSATARVRAHRGLAMLRKRLDPEGRA